MFFANVPAAQALFPANAKATDINFTPHLNFSLPWLHPGEQGIQRCLSLRPQAMALSW